MGNGISHTSSPNKDKNNLADDGHTGQFHKVLVEPEYSIPAPPMITDDPHNTATLKIGTKPDFQAVDANKAEFTVVADKKTKQQDSSFFSSDRDYAIIEDDGCGLGNENGITDVCAAEKLKILELKGKAGSPENINQDATCDAGNIYDDDNIPDDEVTEEEEVNKPSKTESTELAEKSPLSEEPEVKLNKEPVKKENKSLLNMFKFSKHKPKVVAEFVPDVSAKKQENEKVLDNHAKQANIIAGSDLIDSLKETSVDGEETLSLVVDKGKDVLIQKAARKNEDEEIIITKETSDKSVLSTDTISQDPAGDIKMPLNVERLNSLDSGIVVDKIVENTLNGEVLVKNAESENNKMTSLINDANQSNIREMAEPDLNITNSSKINLEQKHTKENNETTVVPSNKTEGLKSNKGNSAKSADKNVEHGRRREIAEAQESYEPLEIPETEIRYSPLEDDKGEKSAETPKTKKKSWSFQFGGNKKNVSTTEKINQSTTSVDKIPSSSVRKKSKSIWDKLSFRKSTDDVSMSTNGEVLYENEKADAKKKNKLKKIKAKKEKKGSLKKTSEENEDTDIFSNEDSRHMDGLNTPHSRRSVLEEDAPITHTDLDGVSLSDLSLDGDVQVSYNPKGRESHESPFARELKTSLAKRAEKLSSVSDDDQNTNIDSKVPSNSVHPVAVDIKLPSENTASKIREINSAPDKNSNLQLDEKTGGCTGEDNQGSDKQQSEKVNEYAHIATNKSKINVPLQEIEYANLHALPEVLPVLDEAVNSKVIVEPNLLPEIEKSKTEAAHGGLAEGETTSSLKQSDQNDSNENGSFRHVEQDDKSVNAVSQKLEVNLETNVNASTTVVKDDFIKAENIKEVFSAVKDTGGLQQGNIYPGASDNHDDSDAYVHLVQLVKDYKEDDFEKHLNNKNDTLVTGTNSVLINLVPVSKDSGIIPVPDSVHSDSMPISTSDENEKSATKTRRVVIMKEIGIQAPDIHIPMDIENDFGCRSEHGELVDIGVQVSDHDFEDTGTFKKANSDTITSPSVNIESAFF